MQISLLALMQKLRAIPGGLHGRPQRVQTWRYCGRGGLPGQVKKGRAVHLPMQVPVVVALPAHAAIGALRA